MGSLLGNLSVIQYNNLVRADDSGQSMGDHDDRSSFCKCRKGLLDHGFVFRVGKGGSLIQNNDGGVLQDRSCQRHTLLFAAGQVSTLRPDDCVHTVRQLFQDIVALRRRECCPNLITGRFRAGGSYILQNTGLEQTVILEDKRHLIHQHMRIGISDINATHQNTSGADIPETGNETGSRCFAASGGAHQSYRLSGLHRKRHMVKSRHICSGVSEAYILKFHTVVLWNLGMVCDFQDRCIHDLADPSERRTCQHHAARRKHDLCQRCRDDCREHSIESKVSHKARKAAGGKGCRCQKECYRNQKDKGAFRKGQVHGLGHFADIRLIMLCLGAVIFDGLLKGLKGIYGLLEYLDHGDTADIFRPGFTHLILGCLIFRHEPGVFTAHHRSHGYDRYNCCQQAGGSHPPVKNKHQDQHGDKHGHCSDDIRQVVGKQGFRFRGRSVQAVSKKPRRIGIEEAQRRLH